MAARVHGQPFFAAVAVALFGSLSYFWSVGGLPFQRRPDLLSL